MSVKISHTNEIVADVEFPNSIHEHSTLAETASIFVNGDRVSIEIKYFGDGESGLSIYFSSLNDLNQFIRDLTSIKTQTSYLLFEWEKTYGDKDES